MLRLFPGARLGLSQALIVAAGVWLASGQDVSAQIPTEERWEVGFSVGATMFQVPSTGTAEPLPPGIPFSTVSGLPTRAVSSFLVGDGAILLGEVSQSFLDQGIPGFLAFEPAPAPSLDPLVFSAAFTGTSGASLGFRILRHFTNRVSAEFSLDFSRARPEMPPETQLQIEDSAAATTSFVYPILAYLDPTFWIGGPRAFPTASVEIFESSGQALATGLVHLALTRGRRTVPFVSAGVAFRGSLGPAPGFDVEADYLFRLHGNGGGADESERVEMRVVAPGVAGVVGGGLRQYVTSRWGIRFDARVYLDGRYRTELSLEPGVVQASGGVYETPTTPSLQMADVPTDIDAPRSTLSGPPLDEFATFSTDSGGRAVSLSVGLFWTF